jgi:hypothetical protein
VVDGVRLHVDDARDERSAVGVDRLAVLTAGEEVEEFRRSRQVRRSGSSGGRGRLPMCVVETWLSFAVIRRNRGTLPQKVGGSRGSVGPGSRSLPVTGPSPRQTTGN